MTNLTGPRISVRYIVGALLGAVLGFGSQLLADASQLFDLQHLTWSPAAFVSVKSDIPPLFSDGGPIWQAPYMLQYSPDGRLFGTPYFTEDGKPALPDSPEAKDFYPAPSQKSQWRQLWYQLLLLNWLQENGERACQTAAVAALLAACAVSCVDRMHRKPKAQAATSGTA